MKHKEQNLQINCVKWFRIQYPEYAKLLFHPKNEGATANGRRLGGIAKAEGVVAGVPDLILMMPAIPIMALAIEMKTPKGRQSADQKTWQRYFMASGGLYAVVRSFDEFTEVVNEYLSSVPASVKESLKRTHDAIRQEEDANIKKQLQKILSK